jgi:hypothetical protein
MYHYTLILPAYITLNLSQKIMRAFLDSAGLFAFVMFFLCIKAINFVSSAWGLFHLISYQLRSNIQFVAIDGLPAIVGLTNTLILIRLRLDFTAHATQSRGAATTDLELGQSASEAEAESLKVFLISPSA